MNIKQEIIEICDDMISFWDGLKRKIKQIPNEDTTEIVCKWNDYFPEHSNTTINLIKTKMDIELVERELIKTGVLKCKDESSDD